MILLAIVTLIPVYIASRIYIYRRDRSLSDDRILPRHVALIPPYFGLGVFLPNYLMWYKLNIGWLQKDTMYKDAPLNITIFQPLLFGRRLIYCANLTYFRHVMSSRAPYTKAGKDVFRVIGGNIFSANGEAWGRHRRIVAPTFNYHTYKNVWETTTNVYKEMIKEEGWLVAEGGKEVNIIENTHKVAMFLISIIGFGIPVSWSTPPFDEYGNRSVHSLFLYVTANIFTRGRVPDWLFKLGIKRLDDIDKEYKTFERYMSKLIAQREIELKSILDTEGSNSGTLEDSLKDILGRLVYARLAEGKLSLTDDEIMGNCFLFAFAGHETTANSLAATLAELALNPDKQEWLYKQIVGAIGNRPPTFEDYDNLDCVLASFCEAMRLYPAAFVLTRESEKDEIVSIPSDKSRGKSDILIKKNDVIALDFVGMSYDAETYPDPYSFKPERWLSDEGNEKKTSITKDMDAGEISGGLSMNSLNGFIGFSIGPRTCIGHKFAKVEAVALLTNLIREWRVEPVKEPGETNVEWRKRYLSSPKFKVTLTFGDVPLRFFRREN